MFDYELIKKTEKFLKETFEHATDFEQDDLPYCIEHSYRVANIGREIALKEGFDETEMVIACLLHDIAYYEADGENRFWPAHREHGRRSAQIARPFLEELGLPEERIDDICYGIAIHVDDEADFEGERTPFAVTIGDADNIDRFDAFRLHEMMSRDGFLEKTYEEQADYVRKRLLRLREIRELPTGTKTAEEMWKSRLDFYIIFFEKLANQLKMSNKVIED